jgi:chemotaxis protein CheD
LDEECYLHPGEFAFAASGTRLRTILGSCVAVTFWHPRLRLGAMCHYLLPARPSAKGGPPDGRYAAEVLPLILGHFTSQGIPPRDLEVKMFGGGSMFPHLAEARHLTIGVLNIHRGLMLLARHGCNIVNHDLAGATNRNVIFDVQSGEVLVRQGR